MGRVRLAVVAFWRKAYEDNLTGLASMVAYNLLLSIFPVALVALFFAGRVLSSPEVQASVLLDLQQIFPTAAESTLSEAVRRLQESSTTTGIVAIVAAVWFASSFWGALDTAFCQIYHRPCRSWVQQKLFALGMFAVVLLFIVASVAVPTLQGLLVTSAEDLPFGLSEVRGLIYAITLAAGVVILFGALCATYLLVPSGSIPWGCVWPGALAATLAMAIVDYGFPLYLQNVTTLRAGTTFVFVLIALVWFYALAMILLAGAVVNELRFERLRDRNPRATRYFRRWSADDDPAQLLEPENQWSTPWGGAEHGPCEKCGGDGTAHYRCCSCLERGAKPDCPACGGRVEFDDVCPSCEGDGTIDRTRRRGVGVFPSAEGLYRYLAEREAGADDCVLELEGELTGDRDLDADAGAVLVRPTRIVAVHRFDRERLRAIDR